MIGTIIRKRPSQHRDAEGDVVEGRVRAETGEGRAVVAGARSEGIEDLGEPVRTRIPDALQPGVVTTATAVKPRMTSGRTSSASIAILMS